jgi:hypothetical protein
MTGTLLCISHAGAFLLGGVTWWGITRWEGRRLLDKENTVETDDQDRPHPARRLWDAAWGPTPGAVALVCLLAAAVLIGFGVQQGAYQKQARDRDECYETWGRDVTDALDKRVAANSALTKAQQDRDDAVAEILRVVIGLRAKPPETTEAALDEALGAARDADDRVDRLTVRAEETRKQNPYPVLSCE